MISLRFRGKGGRKTRPKVRAAEAATDVGAEAPIPYEAPVASGEKEAVADSID